MPAYKDPQRKTWTVKFSYKTHSGERKFITRRGFSRKRDAVQYERDFLNQQREPMGMTFAEFVEVYYKDLEPRIKATSLNTKKNVVETKLLPHFGTKRMCDITAADVLLWDDLMARHIDGDTGKPYSKSYLRTLHSQLSTIFNHAVRYYNLKKNPARSFPHIEPKKGSAMTIWTREQYQKFAEYMMGDPEGYYCFQLMYWCGLKEGEAFALNSKDFDFKANTISVTKTCQYIKGEAVITELRTMKGNRVVEMPAFLAEELEEYIRTHFASNPLACIFDLNKKYLSCKIKEATTILDLPKIRAQDIRHSHAMLLLSMGCDVITVAKRMGIKPEEVSLRYAGIAPDEDTRIANRLDITQYKPIQKAKANTKEQLPAKAEEPIDCSATEQPRENMTRQQNSEKRALDGQGRWRNKTIGIRVSPEENDKINALASLSGMSKQDYCIKRLLQDDIVVTANPRVYKALKTQIERLCVELSRLGKTESIQKDTIDLLKCVVIMCDQMHTDK